METEEKLMKLNREANDDTSLVKFSRWVFLVLTILFILFFISNKQLYLSLIQEDSAAEWLTFAFLIIAGVVSLVVALKIRRQYHYLHWFFWLFFAFNIFAGFEEISWGQRIFGMKTEGVFAKYSDQNEINLHNTLQGMAKVKTKHIAMYALFVYGVILPWLISKKKISGNWLARHHIIVPPIFLTSGFLIATLFMIDVPTGNEEEVGELLYSLCFVLLMLHNLHLVNHSGVFEPEGLESRSKSTPSFKE